MCLSIDAHTATSDDCRLRRVPGLDWHGALRKIGRQNAKDDHDLFLLAAPHGRNERLLGNFPFGAYRGPSLAGVERDAATPAAEDQC